MNWTLYIILSAMMGLQFAIWGAWAPVLATRLLGPMKLNGKQTGWIYSTLPLACIAAPLLAGQLADKYLNTEWILAGGHLIGGVLLFMAAFKNRFKSLFIIMLLYSFCYAATLPLVNALMFRHVTDESGINVGHIFMWAPIAWALVGYGLTGWRWKFKTGEQGRDCLFLAAGLSIVMAITCLFLPATAPARVGAAPILKAMSMLQDTNFLIFILVSMAVAGMMQFYFLGTAQFLQDSGIPSKNVPATMAIAQAVQTVATFFALGFMTTKFGFKTTLLVGMSAWLAMYTVYAISKPRWLVISVQSLHGIAYVLFIIAGQIMADTMATAEIRSSMQALVFAATMGIGLFLGTQAAGIVMDKYCQDSRFNWKKIFLVPCILTGICLVLFFIMFKNPTAT